MIDVITVYCFSLLQVTDSKKNVSSRGDKHSNSPTNTDINSVQLSNNSLDSQKSLNGNKGLAISKSLNLNESQVNKLKFEFANNNEREIHSPIMKQYCVVAKHTETSQQTNTEEPIVLLLKVNNNQSNENLHSIRSDNESTNQILTIKKSNQPLDNEIAEKAKMKENANSIKSSGSTANSNETKRSDCQLTCRKCKKKTKNFTGLRHHMYTHIKPHRCKYVE